MSRTGKVHFVSSRRLFRHALVLLFGYKRRGRTPRATLGRWRWLSPGEHARIRAEALRGRSAKQIASRMGRDRRTIDRSLWR